MSRRIYVVSAKPGKERSGTVYALSTTGAVYKADAYVAGDDIAAVVAAINARGYIIQDYWSLLKWINPEQLSLEVA
jgi:hypothetical protein